MSAPQRFYALLLRVYPVWFRRRYAEMALADFGAMHQATARREGSAGVVLLWLKTIPAVVRDGLRERRGGSSPGRPGRDPRERWNPTGWVEQLLRDIRYAARNLIRSPGFALAAVAIIAIGMAANATVFGITNAIMFAELPYGEADDLAVIWTTYPERGVTFSSTSLPDWADLRSRADAFEDIAFHDQWEVNLSGVDEPLALTGYSVTTNLLDVLRAEPLLGRGFGAADGEVGAAPVVVLSWRLWQRLGADPEIVGSVMLLDELEYTVLGVMGEGFEYPQMQTRGDLWRPAQMSDSDLVEGRSHRHVIPIGRLAGGADISTASEQVATIMGQLEAEYPLSNEGSSARAVLLREQMSEVMRPATLVLLATVGFVLLICCANVANLFLARTATRRGELAVRAALGASRAQLVRQFLTESVLVALVGGILGHFGADIAGRFMIGSLPDFVFETSSAASDTGVDPVVLLVTFGVAALAGLVAGVIPALRASRQDVDGVLRDNGAKVIGPGGSRLRRLLVVAEVATAVVLIAGAGLMVQGFAGLLDLDLGFEPEQVLTLELAVNGPRYEPDASRQDYYRTVADRVRALPEVQEAGVSSLLPLGFYNNSTAFLTEATEPDVQPPYAGYRFVGPGYLEAMGAELLQGRLVEFTDDLDADRVVVVTEPLLRHLPEGDPIGMRIRDAGEEEWMTIVGVIRGWRDSTLLEPPGPAMFRPYAQSEGRHRMFVAVKAAGGDAGALTTSVRTAVREVDPAIPIDSVRTLGEIVDDSLFVVRLPTTLMAAFGATALVLAAVGLYAVLAYLVAQRSREVGIRLALGAQRGQVLRLILRNSVVLAGVGIALGMAMAVPLGGVLAAVLEGVSATDPVIFVGVPVLLLAVTLLATVVPARRALRVDPVVSLRSD